MDFDSRTDTYEVRYPGIFSEGFGIVPRTVLTNQNLSVGAKLLYSYLACCSNKEGIAFPSIQKIREDLGLGRDAFRRSRQELETEGYISVFQKKQAGGRFGHSVFLLNLDPKKPTTPEKDTLASASGKLSASEQDPSSTPSPDFPSPVNRVPVKPSGKLSDPPENTRSAPSPDLPATEKQPTKNTNWIDNPSNQKDNLSCEKADTPTSFPPDGRAEFKRKKKQSPSSQTPSPGFVELCTICVNRNLIHDPRTQHAYNELLAEGYTPADILCAWKRRQAEAKQAARAARFYPQLFKWLVAKDTQGARAQIDAALATRKPNKPDKPNKPNKPNKPHRPQTWAELAKVDEAFARIFNKHNEACKAACLYGNPFDAREKTASSRREVEAEAKRALARWDEAHSSKEVSTHA